MKSSSSILTLLLCTGLLLPSPSQGGSIKRIKTSEKVVALTFDDGPNPPYTEQLLKVLSKKKVRATFFLIGNQIEAHPETVLKKVHPGAIIALHDGGGNRSATLAAIPEVIDALRKKGYAILTVGELLGRRSSTSGEKP